MADEENNLAAENPNTLTGQLAIQKVYVKDISFEAPNSPVAFQEQGEPQVNMEMTNNTNKISDVLHDVVLGITLTVSANDKTIYLVEVKQAGIFHIEGFPEQAVDRILATACPNILFPFARELVAELVTRGGFSQLLLAPVNFDVLYMQQQMQQQQAATEETKH